MNNPSEYLGYDIKAIMERDGSIVLCDKRHGDCIKIPQDAFQALVKFRAAAQVEIALRQNLEPAYQFVNDNKT